ncbi:DUF3035 domain-containing protein [Pelagibacteraceae bacterium]|nr:DUF3035 domain-containing protein [Pelagibacteraceae bacterium]
MIKKIIYSIILIGFISSCSGTFDSVKRGLTGEKQKSTDEFLVKKKDPLILPPNFEDLPTPESRKAAQEDISNFEKTLTKENKTKSVTSSSSAENSILQKIKNK